MLSFQIANLDIEQLDCLYGPVSMINARLSAGTRHLRPTSNCKLISSLAQTQRTEARHCFRRLLREASYLPDPWSRIWVKSRTRHKFRQCKSQCSHENLILDGRKYLRLLSAANAGSKDHIEKILHHAYGRTGKWRHELLHPFLAASEYGKQDVPPDLSPSLRVLIQSQIKAKPPQQRKNNPRTIKDIAPNYDELNSWLEPISKKRAIRKANKALVGKLDRLQVPLPGEQWEFLKAIVLDGEDLPAIPRFRSRRGIKESPVGEESSAGRGRISQQTSQQPSDRRFTQRFLRRRYQTIFAQCPHMSLDERNDRWTVQWGHQLIHDAMRRQQMPLRDTTHELLFEDHQQEAAPEGCREVREIAA